MAHTPEFLTVLNTFAAHASKDMDRLYLAAVRCAAENGRVTCDDLRDVELTTPDRDKRIFGGALAQLKRKGVLVIVGGTGTKQKSSNGRPIYVFALAGDWRSRWLKSDRLPVPQDLVDLKTEFTQAEGQVAQDELFAVLTEVARCADAGLHEPLADPKAWLQRIADATRRWAPVTSAKIVNARKAGQRDAFAGAGDAT